MITDLPKITSFETISTSKQANKYQKRDELICVDVRVH